MSKRLNTASLWKILSDGTVTKNELTEQNPAALHARLLLINHYTYLAQATSWKILPNLSHTIEREDLFAEGIQGLIKAVDNFDISKKIKFETYAINLIRGRILEHVRKQDWAPRSVRAGMKSYYLAESNLISVLGRKPTFEELANEMRVAPDALDCLLAKKDHMVVSSLDATFKSRSTEHDTECLKDEIRDKNISVEDQCFQGSRNKALSVALGCLLPREKQVLNSFYVQGNTFEITGHLLAMSESRARQIHIRAVARLRQYLKPNDALFVK